MVCACLRDENPKTQTRRIVKVPLWEPLMEMAMAPGCAIYRGAKGEQVRSPYGYSGTMLWVRETWGRTVDQKARATFVYRADGAAREELYTDEGEGDPCDLGRKVANYAEVASWRPAIHMPRHACRLWLEVVSVRVERVQDITEADAIAEGIEPHGVTSFDSAMRPQGHGWKDYSGKEFVGGAGYYTSPIDSYRSLWDSINGKGSFKANPWVWRIAFQRTEKPQ